ncbi:MAG: hydantoinase B/oxoprolinase family protein [Gammaproteobacteria bacterium]
MSSARSENNEHAPAWQFWIDRGGTFTDVIARSPDGNLTIRKLLSENRGRYDDAAVAGIERILNDAGVDRDGSVRVDAIKMGTTVATNALLERRGEPTVLVATRGFRDALRIGYQNRPDIFALNILLPEQLYARVIEVDERLDASGAVLMPPDADAIERDLRREFDAGYRSVAICLLNAYRNAEHERLVAAIATRIGFAQVSPSHEVSPLRKLVSRGDTTVADAYLSPVLMRYIERLKTGLADARLSTPHLMFMQSNGGLVDEAFFRGKDSILSGPAGGVVGMAGASATAGGNRLIGFDMGGTSTDVSLYAGEFELVTDTEIAGVRMRSPMIRVHTIAAGGGSILKFASGRFQVGPESAGADPGPVAYRGGGPLTVTDANVLLGRILPDRFPHVFGVRGDEPLDAAAVAEKFAAVAAEISARTGRDMSPEDVADGFIRIAVDNMANAIKRVSIQRGFDPAEFTLCCFGGAGGQHACRVADQLGIRRILVHPLAGVLSAFGMGIAPLRSYRHTTVERQLSQSALDDLLAATTAAGDACRDQLIAQRVPRDAIRIRTILDIKVAGADTTLPIKLDTAIRVGERFEDAHQRRFGVGIAGRDLVIESLRVEASGRERAPAFDAATATRSADIDGADARVFDRGRWHDAMVHDRDALAPGTRSDGPAVITDRTSTTVVDAGWTMTVDNDGQLLLTRDDSDEARDNPGDDNGTDADPVLLEVFNSHFMNVAEQMGAVLENTAHSVNIKERLDFSCALFDPAGNLIANAPHMPVHLGSMGDSVQAILRDNADTLRPGDAYMLNTPYNGGSHLPDITVVTPVFDDAGANVQFVVACRAHHADIGGLTPGSMPPLSRTIDEEGALFDNFKLIDRDTLREADLRAGLAAGRWPARNPDQNVADVMAQLAANAKGVRELGAMIRHFGRDTVAAYMRHVQNNAEACVRTVIDRLSDGDNVVELDNGARIRVAITVDAERREAEVSFDGTSPQSATNFNAPVAVTRAAVLYVFRTLVAENIPLNAGCLIPIRLCVPDGSLLNPKYPAAVVAGNVETSQVITNAIYGALGVVAAAQGTMNNLTFGNERHQYYETICGGSGAGPDFDGTDAVHTAMTNSRLTDPEVLEARYPIRVVEFAIRRGSGGRGRHRGGDGVIRKLEFLEPMRAAILSNNRTTRPPGLAGGEPGRPGRNSVLPPDGPRTDYGPVAEFPVSAGDVLVIETPGGGGYGIPVTNSGDR